MKLTLSTTCFRFDSPVSCKGVALADLSLSIHDLVIYTDGFLCFLLTKEAPAFFPAAYFVVLKYPFLFDRLSVFKFFG